MSQLNPIDLCKLRETKENEVELALKMIEQKKEKVQLTSKIIKEEVDSLQHENILLDKEIKCAAYSNLKIEKNISILKSKTCEAASSIENMQWKMFKTDMLKVFENERNETTNEKKSKYNQRIDPEILTSDQNCRENNISCLDILNENINVLTKEIELRKTNIEMTDPKLDHDIEMLQKRNAALLKRYQRQLQEAECRLRQMYSELNSLKTLLSQKESLNKK